METPGITSGGRWRRWLWAAAAAAAVLVVWLLACVWAEIKAVEEAAHCKAKLSQWVYPVILEYRLRRPNAPLPPRWPGAEREPTCEGSGRPVPYVYLPVPNLAVAARTSPPAWLAHCPAPHKRRWWVPAFLHREDRIVLDARGAVHGLTEREFHAGPAPQSHKGAPK